MHTTATPTAETGETPQTYAERFPEFYGDGSPLQHLAGIKAEDTADIADTLAELQSTHGEAAA